MLVAGVGYWAVKRASAMFAVATSASALVGGLCGAFSVAFFFSFSGIEADVVEVWSYGIPGVAAAVTCAMICRGKEAHVPDAVPSA
jgi:NhaP-type Na+/H+ or K+/H+ antiporter